MDLEQLTKTQIILLTLFVSFVTSIATGIVTVSLMEEAPTDVTRVISRIVERPIETIIPGDTKTVVEERTVIISEGERIAEAVKKAEGSIVRLATVSSNGTPAFVGFGIIIAENGAITTDRRILDKRKDYVATLASGVQVSLRASDPETEAGDFQFGPTKERPLFTVATLAPFDTLALGQSVVALSGEITTRIAPGVIAELLPTDGGESVSRLHATVDATSIALGSPLIDLEGRIIGMPENAGSNIFLTLHETNGP